MQVQNTKDIIKYIRSYKKLFDNTIIADVAGGSGWVCREIEKVSKPKRIDLIDIREEWFKKRGHGRIPFLVFHKENIYNYTKILKILDQTDIILYFGHFYHTNQHNNIIKNFSKTKAKHLFLESKVFNLKYPKHYPSIYWYMEYTSKYYNSYSNTEEKVKVGEPNLLYTLTLLEKYGWVIDNYDNGFGSTTNYKHLKKEHYIIHAVR